MLTDNSMSCSQIIWVNTRKNLTSVLNKLKKMLGLFNTLPRLPNLFSQKQIYANIY